jgi:hypothetical protein
VRRPRFLEKCRATEEEEEEEEDIRLHSEEMHNLYTS